MILTGYLTEYGSPKDGLPATVTVVDLDTMTKVVDGDAAINIPALMSGVYYYDFVGRNNEHHYVFRFDGGAGLPAPERYDAPKAIDPDDLFTSNVEGTITVQEALAVLLAFAAGKVTGAGTTTISYQNQAKTVDRLKQYVDKKGNRSDTDIDTSDL